MFLWPRRSAVVVFQPKLQYWILKENSLGIFKIHEFKKFLKFIKSDLSRRPLHEVKRCCPSRFCSHRTSLHTSSFSIAAPIIWNSLPPPLWICTGSDTFRRHLQTDYFQQAPPFFLRLGPGLCRPLRAFLNFTHLLTYLFIRRWLVCFSEHVGVGELARICLYRWNNFNCQSCIHTEGQFEVIRRSRVLKLSRKRPRFPEKNFGLLSNSAISSVFGCDSRPFRL